MCFRSHSGSVASISCEGLSLNSVCFRSHSGSVASISCEGLSFSSVCFRSHSGSVVIISCEGLSFSSVCFRSHSGSASCFLRPVRRTSRPLPLESTVPACCVVTRPSPTGVAISALRYFYTDIFILRLLGTQVFLYCDY